LGDNGSLVLGFIISYLSVKNYNYEVIKYADDIFISMMIPGFDMLRLFIVRYLNKKNPFYPDRQHIHHILIKKNNLKKTTLIIFGLCLFPILLRLFNFSSLIIMSISALVYLGILKKYKAI
jgi:UDP-N-acetylmuramyl pentapeptide phosphotransferase/UDP-N-acetylglucosamine-1-phosphate transferase